MKRDGLTRDEATMSYNNFLENAQSYIDSGDGEALEDLLMDELGLEPDYIFDILGFQKVTKYDFYKR